MAVKLDWQKIEEGREFDPWDRGGIGIELFQAYGEASLDGNPMHTDEEYAQDLGYPTVFAQGMLLMAFAAKYITDLFGVGSIRRIWSKFAKQTWPGETLRFSAVVKKKYEEGDRKLLDLDVRGIGVEKGEEKIVVEATVVLG
ncbi:MAG TPA: MaoC/PaaZ C-terminal domain-containing protein [bacterium]|nr:MaoC/PaaZ C-terminal domain-containing protein [bacterium]